MVKQAEGNYRILLAIIDMASKLACESIFEADMADGAYGYRPKLSH